MISENTSDNTQAKALNKIDVITSFNDVLGTDKAWTLYSVLEEMEDGVKKLLHKHGYDGNNWEELQACLKFSKYYREKIQSYLLQQNE